MKRGCFKLQFVHLTQHPHLATFYPITTSLTQHQWHHLMFPVTKQEVCLPPRSKFPWYQMQSVRVRQPPGDAELQADLATHPDRYDRDIYGRFTKGKGNAEDKRQLTEEEKERNKSSSRVTKWKAGAVKYMEKIQQEW